MDDYYSNHKFLIKLFTNFLVKDITHEKILSAIDKICEIINVETYQEIDFVYHDGKKTKSKGLLNKPANIQKFLDVPSECLETINFISHLAKKRIVGNRSFNLTINIVDNMADNSKHPKYPSEIKIEFDSRVYDINFFSKDKIIKLIKCLFELPMDVQYGMGFNLESIKIPWHVVMGVPNNHLDDEEYLMTDALRRNIRNVHEKIWDIFDVNLIKKELISDTLMEEIQQLLPNENIIELGKFYLIRLPLSDDYIQRKSELNIYRNKLRPVFEKYNLLMERTKESPKPLFLKIGSEDNLV